MIDPREMFSLIDDVIRNLQCASDDRRPVERARIDLLHAERAAVELFRRIVLAREQVK